MDYVLLSLDTCGKKSYTCVFGSTLLPLTTTKRKLALKPLNDYLSLKIWPFFVLNHKIARYPFAHSPLWCLKVIHFKLWWFLCIQSFIRMFYSYSAYVRWNFLSVLHYLEKHPSTSMKISLQCVTRTRFEVPMKKLKMIASCSNQVGRLNLLAAFKTFTGVSIAILNSLLPNENKYFILL